jgi:hypothetical protein
LWAEDGIASTLALPVHKSDFDLVKTFQATHFARFVVHAALVFTRRHVETSTTPLVLECIRTAAVVLDKRQATESDGYDYSDRCDHTTGSLLDLSHSPPPFLLKYALHLVQLLLLIAFSYIQK